jgi:hypothetical protein
MDNKSRKKKRPMRDDNIEFEEINDGPNEEGTPVNEKAAQKYTAKKISQKKA